MFRSLCQVAAAAVNEGVESELHEEPWLTADDLWIMLDLLHVDNVQITEVEDVMEEAQVYHTAHADNRAPPLRTSAIGSSKRQPANVMMYHSMVRQTSDNVKMLNTVSRSGLQPRGGKNSLPTPSGIGRVSSDGSNGDTLVLPITSILAGSARFRRMLSALTIDADLCALLNTKLAKHLSEGELRNLLPCQVPNTPPTVRGVLAGHGALTQGHGACR